MEVSLREESGLNVIGVEGRIDHANSGGFAEALEPYLADCNEDTPPLVFDLSKVDYISSAGLRILMMTARRIKAQNGKFGVASIQPVVQEVFTISKFHLVLPCFNDLEAARQSLV